MEEKDINNIASAVSNALAKLNADTTTKEEKKPDVEEVFNCPECGTTIKGGTAFCQGCGCCLEWEV